MTTTPTLAERITARRAAWAALNSAWDAAHAAQAVYDACYDAWASAARGQCVRMERAVLKKMTTTTPPATPAPTLAELKDASRTAWKAFNAADEAWAAACAGDDDAARLRAEAAEESAWVAACAWDAAYRAALKQE